MTLFKIIAIVTWLISPPPMPSDEFGRYVMVQHQAPVFESLEKCTGVLTDAGMLKNTMELKGLLTNRFGAEGTVWTVEVLCTPAAADGTPTVPPPPDKREKVTKPDTPGAALPPVLNPPAPAPAAVPTGAPVVTVTDSPGGVVASFDWFFSALRESGVRVRVDGICVSACTLVLSLPAAQVCVTPRTSFGFHLASMGDRPDTALTAALVARYYPVGVQELLSQIHLTPAVTFISGAEVARAAGLAACK